MAPLTLLVALPLLGALAVAAVPRRRPEVIFPLAIAVSLPPLAVVLWILASFEPGDPGFQLVESVRWSAELGIGWRLGIDGISLFLVVLTTVLMPLAIAASKSIVEGRKAYMVSMLVLETGLLGVFVALDLVVFFAFFEIVLVPMYLLIGLWGSERRRYAAMKFVLYTAIGSAFLLAGILALGLAAGEAGGALASFDFRDVAALDLSVGAQRWLFVAFALAFAIKVPVFPLHTWLPDAHTEAPTAGSVVLAGVLLKMGTYGLVRFNLTLFPQASVDFAGIMVALGVVGIVYGAAVAIVQPDVKRLVAYSSISHLGFVVLGTFALTVQGIGGGIFLGVSHGLTTGALFLLIGMLYDRRHTRRIDAFGGIASVMPVYAGVFLFMAFASAGLPALSGFVGEFTVLLGSFPSYPAAAIVAGSGVVLAAVYLLWAYERIFTGPVTEPENEALDDLDGRELAILVPLVALVLVLGLYPRPVLDRIEPAVSAVLERIEAETGHVAPAPALELHVGGGEEG